MKKIAKIAIVMIAAFMIILNYDNMSYAASETDFTVNNGTLVKYNGSGGDVVIPEGVTAIGDNAFDNITSITSVYIPRSVTQIGEWAFYHCTGLTSVEFPSSITKIGSFAFADCTEIRDIALPDGVITLGDGAFAGCNKLETVSLPGTITSMNNTVFSECNQLVRIANNSNIALTLNEINAAVWYDEMSDHTITTIKNGVAYNGYGSQNVTVYEGIDYAAVYNSKFYADNNPDVVAALGKNPELLLKHFVLCGMSEGRYAKESFNVITYKYGMNNQDIRNAYGDDIVQYYYHYINFGQKEGRTFSGYESIFDATYYLNNNPDVKEYLVANHSDSKGWALWHFYEYGMKEGRKGNGSFGVLNYLAANGDVFDAYNSDFRLGALHYIINGKNEGRKTMVKIDLYAIPQLRPDVKKVFGMDYAEWIRWYLMFGHGEYK